MPAATVCGSPKMSGNTMLKTYREIAIEQMIATVEEAMSQVLDYWGDLSGRAISHSTWGGS